jgi:hypothetical protein
VQALEDVILDIKPPLEEAFSAFALLLNQVHFAILGDWENCYPRSRKRIGRFCPTYSASHHQIDLHVSLQPLAASSGLHAAPRCA